jgi:hypothetical protein
VALAVTNQAEITTREAQIDNWDISKNRLYYYIVSFLGAEVRPLVDHIEAGEARLVWIALCDHYQSSSISAMIKHRMVSSSLPTWPLWLFAMRHASKK